MKKNKDLKKIIEKVISVFIIDYKGPYYEFESNDFDNEGFIEYDEDDSKTICNYYVKKQKFYLDDESKNILVKWTSRYYRILNMHLRQLINVSKEKEKEYEIFKKKIIEIN